jgi:excisionase family DNA binding protein
MFSTWQVSEMLNVSDETVRRWIRNGELEAEMKDGKSFEINGTSLRKMIVKKAKEPGNAIYKMATLVAGNGNNKAVNPESFVSELMGDMKINLKKKDFIRIEVGREFQNPDAVTIEELKYLINYCEIDKRILEHEYQTRILNIEKEIARYKGLVELKLREDESV